MPKRIYNFAAGPAVLPVPVIEEAREALLSLGNTGIGILEHSHRGKAFLTVYNETVSLVREVGEIPKNYDVLFLQGGASSQFFMVPMNLLAKDRTADYLVTGSWSEKARRNEAVRPNARRLFQQGPQLLLHPRQEDLQRAAGLRPLHFEQHDLRHGILRRARKPRGKHADLRRQQRHFFTSDRRSAPRLDLRRCSEEPRTGRGDARRHPEGSGRVGVQRAADDAAIPHARRQ